MSLQNYGVNMTSKMKASNLILKKEILGFALTGLLSSLFMFGIYVELNRAFYYQYAYLIAFSFSVLALYFMNIKVFKSYASFPNFWRFCLIYGFQYLISAPLLEIIIRLGFPVTYAPLLVLVILFPGIFVLNRTVLKKRL
jgi:hypothetical protein